MASTGEQALLERYLPPSQCSHSASSSSGKVRTRWGLDTEERENLAMRDSTSKEPGLSWWTASVSEGQALERLIDQKLSKAVQLTGSPPDLQAEVAPRGWLSTKTIDEEELFPPPPLRSPRLAASTAIPALELCPVAATASSPAAPKDKASAAASAAAAVYSVTASMELAALREEVARLSSQVRHVEEQLGRVDLDELDSKVDNLCRSFAVLKDQMHSIVRDRQLDLQRSRKEKEKHFQSSSSALFDCNPNSLTAMRQELDDFRARWGQLARQVEEHSQAASMCASIDVVGKDRLEGLRREQQAALETAIADLRRELLQTRSASASSAQEPQQGSNAGLPSKELTEAMRQVNVEAREVAREAAQNAAFQAAKDVAQKAAHDAAKEAAKIAANETAREVAHIAAFEAVEATAEKAREAAREVACAELASLRAGSHEEGAISEKAVPLRKELEEKQAAFASEVRRTHDELKAELAAAVAAMSKEVTSSCSEAVAACRQEIQGRYGELLSITNSHTSRFSKLRLQVEAMRQDGFSSVLNTSTATNALAEQEGNGGEQADSRLADKVTMMQRQVSALRSKLQSVESELYGDSKALSSSVEGLRPNESENSSPLKSREMDCLALEVAEAAFRRQRELETEMKRIRSEAATAEPALSSLKAECEALRVDLRLGLEKLAQTTLQQPSMAPRDDGEEWKSQFDHHFLNMATALGEEFDSAHLKKLEEFDSVQSKKLADMAGALEEEFDRVFKESGKVNEELANEFRQNYVQLFTVVQGLVQREATYASELQARQQSRNSRSTQSGREPVDVMPGQSDEIVPLPMQASAGMLQPFSPQSVGDAAAGYGVSNASQPCLPVEIEKLRQEHQDKLNAMVLALGDEFENAHAVRLTEALKALGEELGEEFEKVHAERNQSVDELAEEFRQNFWKLNEFINMFHDKHTNFVEESRQTQDKLSESVEDLKRMASAAQLEPMRQGAVNEPLDSLSSKGLQQQNSGRTNDLGMTSSQKLHSVSNADPVCKSTLDVLSMETNVFQEETEAISKVAVQLGIELQKAGLTNCLDELTSFQQLLDGMWRLQTARLASMAQRLKAEINNGNAERWADAITDSFSGLADALGEEFDKVQLEKHQPIESCLIDLRENQLQLATVVKDLQRQRIAKSQTNGQPWVIGDHLDANAGHAEELHDKFASLSKVVNDLVLQQNVLAGELDAVRRKGYVQEKPGNESSPQGRLQNSPGVDSQESTSDSKRELRVGRTPDGMSDVPSVLRNDADVGSNLASELGYQLDNLGAACWERIHEKIINLPSELEALRTEHDVKLNKMVEALGDEFENTHHLNLQVHHLNLHDIACALGEEFDKVHAERHEPLEECVAELRSGQERLLAIVENLLERQEYDKKYTDFLDNFRPPNFDSLPDVIEKLQERQSTLSAEIDALRQRDSPADAIVTPNPQKDGIGLQLHQEFGVTNGLRSQLDKVVGAGDASELLEKVAGLPLELQELRREQTAKLTEMAIALGDEFDRLHSSHTSDWVALGEEFDKVNVEKQQLLQNSLVELQQNQAKLAAIVLRQEYLSSLAEYTSPAAAATSQERSKPQSEFESLCCFVRSEIGLKVEALRQELSKELSQNLHTLPLDMLAMRKELSESCKAAHDSSDGHVMKLFQITKEQAVSLEDLWRRHEAASDACQVISGTLSNVAASVSGQEDTAAVSEPAIVPGNALEASGKLVEECNGIRDIALAEEAESTICPVQQDVPAVATNTEPAEDATDHANEILISSVQDREIPHQGELGQGGENAPQNDQVAPASGSPPSPDASEHRSPSEVRLVDWRQQDALRKIMDDELRRARMALESMPHFAGKMSGLGGNMQNNGPPDALESFVEDDSEEKPLSGRWPSTVVSGLPAREWEDTARATRANLREKPRSRRPTPTEAAKAEAAVARSHSCPAQQQNPPAAASAPSITMQHAATAAPSGTPQAEEHSQRQCQADASTIRTTSPQSASPARVSFASSTMVESSSSATALEVYSQSPNDLTPQ